MSGQQHAPVALYLRERRGNHFYRRLGGPQGWSGRAEILVPTGIRSRTVQPVVQSLYRLSYPALAQRVGRGIALLFHDCGTRRGGEWSAARPNRTLPPRKTRYPFLQEVGWAPGAVWKGGKSRPHRDSIPNRPARSSVDIPTELPGPHLRDIGSY